MIPASKRFLPSETVARIARLELEARQVVEGYLTGLHRSPYFGQSVEFVQHREYVAGDDTRRIDWKMWSKTDKYYLKQYEEDTNLRTTLIVDASESMQFGDGERTKFDYTCCIAACLGYLLLRQQDAVGLTVFDSTVRTQLPARTQRNQLHAILAALEVERPREKSDLFDVLRKVADDQSRRGLIVIVSDLLAPREPFYRGLKLLRQRGHEVLVFHVLDDQEVNFDYQGVTKFEGLEGTGDLLCEPRALRDGYLVALREFLDDVRRSCAKLVVDYQLLKTSDSLDAALRHYVNHRMGIR